MKFRTQPTAETIIEKANRYLTKTNVAERYSKPGEFFYQDDALRLYLDLSRAFGRIPAEQRQETMKQVFAQLLKQHPTNHSLASVCSKLEALDLVEMHDAAASGLSDLVITAFGEDRIKYENLLVQARGYGLYSPQIDKLLT